MAGTTWMAKPLSALIMWYASLVLYSEFSAVKPGILSFCFILNLLSSARCVVKLETSSGDIQLGRPRARNLKNPAVPYTVTVVTAAVTCNLARSAGARESQDCVFRTVVAVQRTKLRLYYQ